MIFKGFLCPCSLDESGPSIGRVQYQGIVYTFMYLDEIHYMIWSSKMKLCNELPGEQASFES